MASVRYTWMFRAAAIVFLFFGGAWVWRFGFTDFHVEQRPYGLAGGIIALLVGVFLFRGHRVSIGISAIAVAVVGISAAVFAPNATGPAILAMAGLAIVCGIYSVLAARALTERNKPGEQR
jgi:hypothetical protein